MRPKRIVIVGRRGDPSVDLLLDAWGARSPALLTPKDLTSAGFRHDPARPNHDQATIQGERLSAADTLAVVNRLTQVVPTELDHIRPLDRAYVAAEATALLTSWLSALPCHVINRPQSNATMGPGWTHGRWLREALRLELGVHPSRIEVTQAVASEASPHGPGVSLALVGKEVFGGPLHARAREGAVRLAEAAGTDLLEVHFSSAESDARFWWANILPSMTSDVAAALLRLIDEEATRKAPKGGST